MIKFVPRLLASLLLSTALVGCGGGGDDSSASAVAIQQAATADAGLARFNFWRAQLGLTALTRHAQLDQAAQGHSDYQAVNATISHFQTPGNRGFTGECLHDITGSTQCAPSKVSRIDASGYQFTQGSYAFGEVISRTSSSNGSAAADALIAAIYHRFVIFEPMFKQVGTAAAAVAGGPTYFTTNFTADGLDTGLGLGAAVVYPLANQTDVPRNFFSDQEVPDPVPNRNEVGYPISLHADIWSGAATDVTVTSFEVRPQGGTNLPVQQLWRAVDPATPRSVAAIVPLDVLAANTVYEVAFTGTVAGNPVVRNWSFTTGP
jgi:uncharacterized protein YkwD